MRRGDFFKGLIGTAVALAVKPLTGLLRKQPAASFTGKMIAMGPAKSYPGRLCSPFPKRLHGKLEGWEVENEDGLLSRYGQTYFATYDTVTGQLKHDVMSHRLVNEERGEIQAITHSGIPFAVGDEIRLASTTGVYKGLARSQARAPRVTFITRKGFTTS